MTNDYNPIHVDKEFAGRSPMRGIIAHGTMSVALIWQALRDTLGIDAQDCIHLEIRFVHPVCGDEDVSAGGVLRDGSDPPVYDGWVRNGAGLDVIKGTATVKRGKQPPGAPGACRTRA